MTVCIYELFLGQPQLNDMLSNALRDNTTGLESKDVSVGVLVLLEIPANIKNNNTISSLIDEGGRWCLN